MEEVSDRFAVPEKVAASIYAFSYRVGVANLPDGQSALHFTRGQLDRLGIGKDIDRIPWGSKKPKLPPSRLSAKS